MFNPGYNSADEFSAGLKPAHDCVSSENTIEAVLQDVQDTVPPRANGHSAQAAPEFVGMARLPYAADRLGLDEFAAATGRPDPGVYEAARRFESRAVYRFVKRTGDVVFSLAVIVSFSWLYLLVAILIKLDDPRGPVFFTQEREGRMSIDGRHSRFTMYKFRTMCVDAEERLVELQSRNEKNGPVFKIKNDPRIMRVGKWLRKLSLDELPQFFNVLLGDIPLRILKTRPEFSEESMGAFALPAKSSTNKEEVFSQVASCFASGLRMRRILGLNCNCIGGMETQFLARPVFGVSPVHSGAQFQKSNNGLAKAAW